LILCGRKQVKRRCAHIPRVSLLVHMRDAPLYRASPMYIKCEMCVARECLPSIKSETRVIGARLRFGAHALNISGPACSLPTLNKNYEPSSSHPSVVVSMPWALPFSTPAPKHTTASTLTLEHAAALTSAPEHAAVPNLASSPLLDLTNGSFPECIAIARLRPPTPLLSLPTTSKRSPAQGTNPPSPP
jgi:hypothetical protein